MEAKRTFCARDDTGKTYRLQCDAATKTCLYALDAELDDDGKAARPLDRVDDCPSEVASFQKTVPEGFALVPAIAPAPWGWTRDARGRVFQLNFDLHRRLYVGGGVVASTLPGVPRARGYVDFSGLELEGTLGETSPVRHRLRLFQGEVRLAPFQAEVVGLRYDLSERRRDPLLRITTFVRRPRRSDLHLQVGFLTEVARVEILPVPGRREATVARFLSADVTVDLAQSRDLSSFVRLRMGGAFERSFQATGERGALSPHAFAETDLTLDQRGFHHVTGLAGVELPRYYTPDRGFAGSAKRLRADLGYEVIAFAVNDQPVTLRFAVGAQRRDDVAGLTTGTVFQGNLGLRINLWAPPREP